MLHQPITPAIDTADREVTLDECRERMQRHTPLQRPTDPDWREKTAVALWEIERGYQSPEVVRARREAEMLADMRHTASRTLTNPTVISCERIGL